MLHLWHAPVDRFYLLRHQFSNRRVLGQTFEIGIGDGFLFGPFAHSLTVHLNQGTDKVAFVGDDDGEVTATMKIRRESIASKYSGEVEAMYRG